MILLPEMIFQEKMDHTIGVYYPCVWNVSPHYSWLSGKKRKKPCIDHVLAGFFTSTSTGSVLSAQNRFKP